MKYTLLDVDGCVYHHYSKGGSGEQVEDWLFSTNKLLWVYEQKRIAANNFEKVVVAYGTNRQDYGCNLSNIHRGGTLTPILPLVQSYLDCCTFSEVMLEPFMMADIFGQNHSVGDCYRAILREEYCDSKDETHSSWVFDSSKVSLIYAHAHRVASLHPEMKEIIIDYYDDTNHIIKAVFDFYSKHPQCLPETVQLCIHKYNGKELSHKKVIKGLGLVDDHYDWSVRYLSAIAGSYQREDAEVMHPLIPDNHHGLQIFHEENQYCFGDDKLKICLGHRSFDVAAFLDFRESHIAALESSPKLTANGYTSALNLFIDGLIPKKFVFQNRLLPENRDLHIIPFDELNEDYARQVKEDKKERCCCCFPSFFKKKRKPNQNDGSLNSRSGKDYLELQSMP